MNKVKTSINSVIGIIMIALSVLNLIIARLDYIYRPKSYIVFGIVYLIMTVGIAFFSIKYRNDANKVSKNFASFLPIIALVYLITLIFSFDLSIDHKTYSLLYYEMLFSVTIIFSLIIFFVYNIHFTGFNFRKIQHIINQPKQHFTCTIYVIGIFLNRFVLIFA